MTVSFDSLPSRDGAGAGCFSNSFRGRRVLVTGHTGFKGGWLTLWLDLLGADILAVSLPPSTSPSLYASGRIGDRCASRFADITDPAALDHAVGRFSPELVIHMAAQSIVRDGYDRPAETFAVNVAGTANVLDIARRSPALTGAIVVTSDKCYDNQGGRRGFREGDRLGGRDPYSASKACTELVAGAYRASFFAEAGGPALATVRAGNVIGGGDWAPWRLIPDVVRAIAADEVTVIRNPASLRPWQHVLEPLTGYLMVGAAMLEGRAHAVAGAWNFGPDEDAIVPVAEVCNLFGESWEGACSSAGGSTTRARFRTETDESAPYEAAVLRLDSSKVRRRLGWRPLLRLPEALRLTAEWYSTQMSGADAQALTVAQITAYSQRMATTKPLSAMREEV